MNETPAPVPQKNDHTVAIMSIIATAVVLLTCIAGCSAVMITFAINLR